MVFRGANKIARPYVFGLIIVVLLWYFILVLRVAGEPHIVARFGLPGMDFLADSVVVENLSVREIQGSVNISKPGRFILYTTIQPDPRVNLEIISAETNEHIPVKQNARYGETILEEDDLGVGVPQSFRVPAWTFKIEEPGNYQLNVMPLVEGAQEPSLVLIKIQRDVRIFNYLYLTIGSALLIVLVVLLANVVYYVRNRALIQAEQERQASSREKWDKFKE